MVSDTDIRKTNKKLKARSERSRASGLTLRILAVNVVAPIVLVLGLLYMGHSRDSLIQAELEALKAQSQLFADKIVKEAAEPERLNPEQARRMVYRLGELTDNHTRLFDHNGTMIADSRKLVGPGGIVQIVSLAPPTDDTSFDEFLAYIGAKMLAVLPSKSDLEFYPHSASQQVKDYPDALEASTGKASATAWREEKTKIILSAAAPVMQKDDVIGTVLITRGGSNIERAMAQVRFDVLTFFLGSLSITIFMSIYLAGVIGTPLRKLANAAEQVRISRGRDTNIPDMSHRHDEIGDLSIALREMTQALWSRMDSIERFAADVAHEIKNPLTSLRSAVETAAKVTSDKDRQKLMKIIEHDVQRLDRLISDISKASRLDAELSREKLEKVDLGEFLTRLVDARKLPMERLGNDNNKPSVPTIDLHIPGRRKIIILGNESRLAQVFDNLISNALSFSPSGGTITINVMPHKDLVIVEIEDEGPGIPENKLDTIFERFYTERPKHEHYGSHSGLGLSISKQIIEAHNGRLYAENITDESGETAGARFIIELETV